MKIVRKSEELPLGALLLSALVWRARNCAGETTRFAGGLRLVRHVLFAVSHEGGDGPHEKCQSGRESNPRACNEGFVRIMQLDCVFARFERYAREDAVDGKRFVLLSVNGAGPVGGIGDGQR